MKMTRLFIFSGEPSGDLHGSHLIKALQGQNPSFDISGVCGPEMRKEKITNILDMENFAVMGFSDVFRSLPKLIKQFLKVKNYILTSQPSAVILIDYPGFNLRLAAALRKNGYKGKIIQYISPTVWAWGKERIEKMAALLDGLLTIYPFEEECFKHTKLPVYYVGNPLLEYQANYPFSKEWKKKLNIPDHRPLVALFPGSRMGEIKRNLPKLLETASLLKKREDRAVFAISAFSKEIEDLIDEQIKRSPGLRKDIYLVPKAFSHELMKDACCAVAKSGTVALQLALHQCPSVIIYELSLLNKWIAKYLLKVNLPFYCIVNILGKQEVFPELIKEAYTPQTIYQQLLPFFEESQKRQNCLQSCQKIYEELSGLNASQTAAQAIRNLI